MDDPNSEARLRWPSRPRRWAFLALILAVALAMAGTLTVQATDDLGLFETDRDAEDSNGVPLPDDWDTLYTGGGSADEFTGILPDIGADGGTQFQGGGSKDDLDITSWLWKPGEPLDKDDITNAYAAAYVYEGAVDCAPGEDPPSIFCVEPGDLILYYGLDRFSANGSAQVGFWFLQDPEFGLTNNAAGGGFEFSGAHVDNDILVQSNFSQGGVIDNVTVYKWESGGLVEIFDAADCIGPPPSDPHDPACATVNRSPETAPWPYTPKANEGSPGTFLTGAFFEGGINISALVPDAGCFTGFIAETRTSTPFDARLKDFVWGNFDLCDVDVDKSGDELSKVGDPAGYTITITNTGSLTLYKDDITDTLLGDITLDGVDQANPYVTSNTCGVSLAPGASCEIELTRTVEAGDPDPLPNTVDILYKGKSDLSGSDVSATDDHEVNLFQPAIDLDKTGDTLSKIGDSVDYTITLSNLSSDDAPDLSCTVTDTTVGVDETFSVASGDDHVISALGFVIPEGAADPFPNTADVSCSPDGFPNVLTDSASWEINLFQPAIDVEKTADELSKVGDDVDYVITVYNNSSADTPEMAFDITDTLLGVDEQDVVIANGDSYVINESRTVQAGDPDPLVNTVDVHATIAGFPNEIDDSASATTNLFQPSVEVIKDGPTIATVGETITYEFTINNLSSGDSPDLILDSVTDTVLGDLTATASANGCDTLAAGGSCNFTYDYTIPDDDPNPLDNVVTVHYHPEEFPNDITDDDDHSVEIVVGDEGCTPGYWKTHLDSWAATGYSPSDDFDTVFGVDYFDPDITLEEAINLGGGGVERLARHGVAALLSAAHPDVNYPYTVAQVIAYVQAGDADPLVAANELGCPIN